MERARLFLDLLNLGLRAGRSPERAIVDLSETRDPSLGARFHLLAAWIRYGLRLPEALRRSASLLPEKISAMLIAGNEAGVLPRVFELARRAATAPDAQIRAALSCQIIMLFILNPLIILTLPYFLLHVFPVLTAISTGMGLKPPPVLLFVLDHAPILFACQVASVAILYLAALFYVGGSRFTRWVEAGLFPVSSWMALRIPWKRKRLHRDFAGMLALMLDAGLPETKALELAGATTDNEIFEQRISNALSELRQGMSLPLALELLDPPREFAWRLANALQRKGNFSAALEGWLSALEAEADAQEQSAGDFLSTALLVINGAIVGLVIAGVMQTVYSFSLFPIE